MLSASKKIDDKEKAGCDDLDFHQKSTVQILVIFMCRNLLPEKFPSKSESLMYVFAVGEARADVQPSLIILSHEEPKNNRTQLTKAEYQRNQNINMKNSSQYKNEGAGGFLMF